MFSFRLREYENVVDEDYHKFIQVLHKYFIHEVHGVGWRVCQSKGHHSVLVQSILGVECGLWDI
jgi:hypothetical protein